MTKANPVPEYNSEAVRLHLALELSAEKWLLAFAPSLREKPYRRSINAGDEKAVRVTKRAGTVSGCTGGCSARGWRIKSSTRPRSKFRAEPGAPRATASTWANSCVCCPVVCPTLRRGRRPGSKGGHRGAEQTTADSALALPPIRSDSAGSGFEDGPAVLGRSRPGSSSQRKEEKRTD